jgi:hypothetical protein
MCFSRDILWMKELLNTYGITALFSRNYGNTRRRPWGNINSNIYRTSMYHTKPVSTQIVDGDIVGTGCNRAKNPATAGKLHPATLYCCKIKTLIVKAIS